MCTINRFARVVCASIVIYVLSTSLVVAEDAEIVSEIESMSAALTEVYKTSAALRGDGTVNGQAAKKAPVPTQVSIDMLVSLAKRRSVLYNELAKEHPRKALMLAMSEEKRNLIPDAARVYIERRGITRGVLDIAHVDDVDHAHTDEHGNNSGEFMYFVTTSDGKVLPLYTATPLPPMQSGNEVEIRGVSTTAAYVGEHVVTVARRARPVQPVGVQRTVIIPITFPDKPAPTISPAQIQRRVFSGPTNAYIKEQSYGKASFSGIVTPWLTVQQNGVSAVCLPGVVDLDTPEVQKYIKQRKIDLSKYDRVVFVPHGEGGGCSFVGAVDRVVNGKKYSVSVAWVGLSQSFGWKQNPGYPFDWNYFDAVMIHELGHSLGVMHANALHCSQTALEGDCFHWEYGNGFDVMGGGGFSMPSSTHFNAFYKDYLGWFAPQQKQIVESSGTYSVVPIAKRFTPNDTQGTVQAIKITNPALGEKKEKASYYLELRAPIGFDSALQLVNTGLFLNQISIPQSGYPFPRVIFANMNGDFNTNPAFTPSTVFTDAGAGITIQNATYTPPTKKTDPFPRSAQVSIVVTSPVCSDDDPTVAQYANEVSAVGSGAGVTFEIQNRDSVACAPAQYTVEALLPAPLSAMEMVQPVVIHPFETGYLGVAIVVPNETAPGEYPMTFRLFKNGRQYAERTHVLSVVPLPTITSIVPDTAAPRTQVHIQGSNFRQNVTVFMYNDSGYAFEQAQSYDGKTIIFLTPEMFYSHTSGAQEKKQIVPGTYSLFVINDVGGSSNMVSFTVTPSSLGRQYDSTERNTELISAAALSVWDAFTTLFSR